MGLISLLIRNPIIFILLAIPLLYSIILHEIAHGWTAYLFGDDTAKRSGRLSLNPLMHLDPIGTIALFLVGFGWAKPVPVNYFKLRNSRFGLIAVSMAGCLANFTIALSAVLILKFIGQGLNHYILIMLLIVVKINIILGVFNLIPIPPLDGSKILMGLLPYEAQRNFSRIEPYGIFILLALLFTGMLNPIINISQKIILNLFGM